MTGKTTDAAQRDAAIAWLMQGDPAIRWQTLRDLTDAPASAIDRERARVAVEGWGARLLDLQGADGNWGGQVLFPYWLSTTDVLLELRDLGVEPGHPRVRRAVGLVRDNLDWGEEWGHSPFFEGEVEACINGRVLMSGAYFGEGSAALVARFLSEQLEDGGWNCYIPKSCRSSFHSTICVLEGLLAYEQATGATPEITAARRRGEAYLLERGLFRRRSTGEVIHPAFTELAYPTRWHYDILWALDYLRRAGVAPEPRMAEAVALLAAKQDHEGRWPLERWHEGQEHVPMGEDVGGPSRWNTLRAMRVLDWWRAAAPIPSLGGDR